MMPASLSVRRRLAAALATLLLSAILGGGVSAVGAQEWCAPPPYKCLPPDEVDGGSDYINDAINGIGGGSLQCDSVRSQATSHANGDGFRFADYGWGGVHWQNHPSVGDVFIDYCELEWDEEECDYEAPMPPGYESMLIIEEVAHHMYGPHDGGGPNDQAINSALNNCFSPGGDHEEQLVHWPHPMPPSVARAHGPHVGPPAEPRYGGTPQSGPARRGAPVRQQVRGRAQDTTDVLVVAVRQAIRELGFDDPVAIDADQGLVDQRAAVANAIGGSLCRGRCARDGFARVRLQGVRFGERDATVHLSVTRLEPTQTTGMRFNLVMIDLEPSRDAVGGWAVTKVRIAEG